MLERNPTILVPIDLSSEERPPPELLALLDPAEIVLVGWYPVPDQTALEQMQDEHGAAAIDRIETLAAEFPDKGTSVETLVVFTHDRGETVDRVAEEYGCEAVLVPRDLETVDRILVPIRGEVNLGAILSFVGSLLDESSASVTLFHAVSEDEESGVGEVLLRGAKAELIDDGVDSERIETVVSSSGEPVERIVEASGEHDVLIIGETEPSLVESILGDIPTRIIDRVERPVLVVRSVD